MVKINITIKEKYFFSKVNTTNLFFSREAPLFLLNQGKNSKLEKLSAEHNIDYFPIFFHSFLKNHLLVLIIVVHILLCFPNSNF